MATSLRAVYHMVILEGVVEGESFVIQMEFG